MSFLGHMNTYEGSQKVACEYTYLTWHFLVYFGLFDSFSHVFLLSITIGFSEVSTIDSDSKILER